jgi:hypothetical protein
MGPANLAVLKVLSDRTDFDALGTRLTDLAGVFADLEAALNDIENMPDVDASYEVLRHSGLDAWLDTLKDSLDAIEPLALDLKTAAKSSF